MSGRITSHPSVNAHGVPFHSLLESERRNNAELLERYRQALEAWTEADSSLPNSRERREKLQLARNLTIRAIN